MVRPLIEGMKMLVHLSFPILPAGLLLILFIGFDPDESLIMELCDLCKIGLFIYKADENKAALFHLSLLRF